MARCADRGTRRAPRAVRGRNAARRAGRAGDHVQQGHHPRTAVGDRDRPGRAARVDRGMARAEGTRMTAIEAPPGVREQTRARYPDDQGYIERDGVRVFWEVYGSGEQTVLLLPTWSIIHSRHWKAQIPYLARHFRVVTFDGRGNGRSDRPRGPAAYVEGQFAADALAVMDATATERAVLVGLSCGALWATLIAADHPERAIAVVYIGPAVPLASGLPERAIGARFEEELESEDGWARYNRHYWRRDYLGFLEYFFAQMFNEPHSTKQIEDCVGWGLETDPETLADTSSALDLCSREQFADTCARVRCPVLVIHGDHDLIRPHAQGAALARVTGGELANESRHLESESAEHDLHCFQAIRRMDEILVANFMVFHDLVSERHYDLWIADEGWEIDYYLHENPEEKRAAYVWLTDFVGWLPFGDGGEREAFLTADYNAEMIEHIDRFPRVRDRAIFVGNPEDIVPDTFGRGLPEIADWTGRHYDFAGYVTGFDPTELGDRDRLRAELGYRPAEQVCIVTVGGSGVGRSLLERIMAAFPEAKRRVPELRMIVVAGPRIDPASLAAHDGLELRAYVPDLYRHLAACDLAVVQGGLTTAMELTANRRPFLYFPLRHHFEQNFHVRHRLERYGAGRCLTFEAATPEVIAEAIGEGIGREVDYRPVETDGAPLAAALIAPLLEESKGRRTRKSTPLSEEVRHEL